MAMRATAAGLALLCLAGCATKKPIIGPTVGVGPFTVDQPTDDSERDAAIAQMAASALGTELRKDNLNAFWVPAGRAPYGDVQITGFITDLNYHTGRFGVLVTVRDSTGKEYAKVSASRDSHSMQKCVYVVMGYDIGHNGEFRHALFEAMHASGK